VLAWDSTDKQCVHYRLLDDSLEPVGASQVVEGSCAGQGYHPRIAVGPTGRFVVAYWNLLPEPPPYGCSARAAVFEADGTAAGPSFEVSEGFGCSSEVRVAASPAGDVLFVWNRDDGVSDVIEAKLIPRLVE